MNLIISFSPLKITKILLGTVFALAVFSLVTQILSLIVQHPALYLISALFNVDTERSIPTIFTVMMLWMAAFLCALIALIKKLRKERYLIHWSLLSLIFIFLGWDDAVAIHENLSKSAASKNIAQILNIEIGGIFTFDWLLVAMPIVFLIGLFYLKFIFSLPVKYRKLLLLSAALYLGGTILMEMAGGVIWNNVTNPKTNLAYVLIITLEEVLEMSGIVVFIYSLLAYINLYLEQIKIDFLKEDQPRKLAFLIEDTQHNYVDSLR